jgi:hypothetical protein
MPFRKRFVSVVWVSKEVKETAKLRVSSLYPPYVFTPFSFMCKNLVDEEMSLFSFPSEGFKLKGDRKGRGLFVKSPQQKLRFFIPYSPLSAASV